MRSKDGIIKQGIKYKAKLDVIFVVAANFFVLAFDLRIDPNSFLTNLAIWILLTSLLMRIVGNLERNSLLPLALLLSGVFLYSFPYLGEIIRGNDISFIFYSIYLAVTLLMIRFIPQSFETTREHDSQYSKIAFLIFIFVALVGVNYWLPIFPAAFAISAIFFDRITRDTSISRKELLFFLVCYLLLLTFYWIFIWSGFGRILVGTYFLIPALILFKNGHIKITKLMVMTITPLLLVLSTDLRLGFYSIKQFAGDSASHHLDIMNDLYRSNFLHIKDYGALLEQAQLLFLNWFPRSSWPEKPRGIGQFFVDEYIGRDGFSEGFSVSLGFWGEHMYLNSGAWIVSGFCVVFVLILSTRFFIRNLSESTMFCILLYSNLISLFWGGMATFGSRAWWFIIPFLVFSLAEWALSRLTRQRAGLRKNTRKSVHQLV